MGKRALIQGRRLFEYNNFVCIFVYNLLFQMDSKSVLNASYNDLKDLGLQAIGDIISLKSFCQRKQESGILGKTPSDIEERKQHLKEILERKSTRPVKRKADDDLQNTTRKIYIG